MFKKPPSEGLPPPLPAIPAHGHTAGLSPLQPSLPSMLLHLLYLSAPVALNLLKAQLLEELVSLPRMKEHPPHHVFPFSLLYLSCCPSTI